MRAKSSHRSIKDLTTNVNFTKAVIADVIDITQEHHMQIQQNVHDRIFIGINVDFNTMLN